MGDCLLEKTALNDDEESGKVLLMLGKVQFALQKLVDGYRAHIFQTITVPSESLLNELYIVEEMKNRCDEKRATYEELMKKQKDKGRLRNNKGECFNSPQLQEAREEFDDEANIFVFRIKSLKQGQSRSFLTQASRHHAAQLYFFKKAVGSLEAIEPHVKSLAEQLHIDYQFSDLKHDDNDDGSSDDDTEDCSETHDDHELSFDYRENSPTQVVQPPKKTKELSFRRNSFSFQNGNRGLSKSAPLFPEKKPESADRMAQLQPLPSRRFTSYALPTPDETTNPGSRKSVNETPQTRQTSPNLWHSSPLNQNQYEKLRVNEKLSGPLILDAQSVLKESNTPKPSPLPPPSTEGHPFEPPDPNFASYAKKPKRQAFSGPLTGKQWPNKPRFSASGPIVSSAIPPFSGSLLRTPLPPQPSSTPNWSSPTSHTATSAPKISELHELPRPPHLPARKPHLNTQSGPLIPRHRDPSIAASTLPTPPQTLPRSFSIPAGGPSEVSFRGSSEGSQKSEMVEDIMSPPLTPIMLPTIPPASPAT
ncbi:uncharacterized protein At2g33490 isoform X2 [Andrographis paniculata]|nr:uncharacterized protein At2g33490 isoform X2 [Andrographis paniculata]